MFHMFGCSGTLRMLQKVSPHHHRYHYPDLVMKNKMMRWQAWTALLICFLRNHLVLGACPFQQDWPTLGENPGQDKIVKVVSTDSFLYALSNHRNVFKTPKPNSDSNAIPKWTFLVGKNVKVDDIAAVTNDEGKDKVIGVNSRGIYLLNEEFPGQKAPTWSLKSNEGALKVTASPKNVAIIDLHGLVSELNLEDLGVCGRQSRKNQLGSTRFQEISYSSEGLIGLSKTSQYSAIGLITQSGYFPINTEKDLVKLECNYKNPTILVIDRDMNVWQKPFLESNEWNKAKVPVNKCTGCCLMPDKSFCAVQKGGGKCCKCPPASDEDKNDWWKKMKDDLSQAGGQIKDFLTDKKQESAPVPEPEAQKFEEEMRKKESEFGIPPPTHLQKAPGKGNNYGEQYFSFGNEVMPQLDYAGGGSSKEAAKPEPNIPQNISGGGAGGVSGGASSGASGSTASVTGESGNKGGGLNLGLSGGLGGGGLNASISGGSGGTGKVDVSLSGDKGQTNLSVSGGAGGKEGSSSSSSSSPPARKRWDFDFESSATVPSKGIK